MSSHILWHLAQLPKIAMFEFEMQTIDLLWSMCKLMDERSAYVSKVVVSLNQDSFVMKLMFMYGNYNENDDLV